METCSAWWAGQSQTHQGTVAAPSFSAQCSDRTYEVSACPFGGAAILCALTQAQRQLTKAQLQLEPQMLSCDARCACPLYSSNCLYATCSAVLLQCSSVFMQLHQPVAPPDASCCFNHIVHAHLQMVRWHTQELGAVWRVDGGLAPKLWHFLTTQEPTVPSCGMQSGTVQLCYRSACSAPDHVPELLAAAWPAQCFSQGESLRLAGCHLQHARRAPQHRCSLPRHKCGVCKLSWTVLVKLDLRFRLWLCCCLP